MEAFYTDERVRLYGGKAELCLPLLDENSLDSCVTDPPYELNFMNRKWDNSGIAYSVELWKEVYRVLKPGAHLLAFGGDRTHHRLMCAIEDAGFEIRTTITWLYGSGFPKSLDVSRAIDKAAGVEREILGTREYAGGHIQHSSDDKLSPPIGTFIRSQDARHVTAPATAAARAWSGWGTALKPAAEYIVLARKPLSESSVAANVLRWSTGALNIDACRVGQNHWTKKDGQHSGSEGGHLQQIANRQAGVVRESNQGRWPSNVIYSHSPLCERVGERRVKGGTAVQRNGGGQKIGGKGIYQGSNGLTRDDTGYVDASGYETVDAWACVEGCPVAELDRQSGEVGNGHWTNKREIGGKGIYGGGGYRDLDEGRKIKDSGGASRFFHIAEWSDEDFLIPFRYVAKASRAERDKGLDDSPTLTMNRVNPGGIEHDPRWGPTQVKNNHATVKPVSLLRYLIRLVTPKGGTTLDPFCGSGSSLRAAELEGFKIVGIEMNLDYCSIAAGRVRGNIPPLFRQSSSLPQPEAGEGEL